MGKLKELNDVVDIAKEIMKKDKNIGWLVAIEEAKKIYDSMEIDSLIQKSFDERQIFRYSMRDVIGEKWSLKENF